RSLLSTAIPGGAFDAAVAQTRQAEWIGEIRVLTDSPETLALSRARGLSVEWLEGGRRRSEVERVRAAAARLRSGAGHVLLRNLRYPHVTTETLGRVRGEADGQATVSVRTEEMAVHRFFTFRRRARDLGRRSSVGPSGDVLLARRMDAEGRSLQEWVSTPAG